MKETMDEVNGLGAADRFRNLPAGEQRRYLEAVQQMVRFARDHAVPIIFAPPLSVGGKLNGATGCIIRLNSGPVVMTASHVLRGYEDRLGAGEILNWQVGNLPPFDPITRVVWRDAERDVVVLRLTEREIAQIGHCIIPAPIQWPPCTPTEGQHVLLGGYPQQLREVDSSAGKIGSGPYAAMLPVVKVGEGYFMCQLEPKDLISYNGSPLPDPEVDLGGLSGGPALLVRKLDYPVVGVITDQKNLFNGLHLLRVATLAGIEPPEGLSTEAM